MGGREGGWDGERERGSEGGGWFDCKNMLKPAIAMASLAIMSASICSICSILSIIARFIPIPAIPAIPPLPITLPRPPRSAMFG
jgi:hypothetical protein